MRPFNLEEALAGKPVVTKDGTKVEEIVAFRSSSISQYPVMAVINGGIETYTREGYYHNDRREHPKDLCMAPETQEAWVNIFRGALTGKARCGNYHYETEQEAKDAGRTTLNSEEYVATIKISWEE